MLLRNSLVRCDLHRRTRILPRLTGNEVVIAQSRAKALSVNVKRRATGHHGCGHRSRRPSRGKD